MVRIIMAILQMRELKVAGDNYSPFPCFSTARRGAQYHPSHRSLPAAAGPMAAPQCHRLSSGTSMFTSSEGQALAVGLQENVLSPRCSLLRPPAPFSSSPCPPSSGLCRPVLQHPVSLRGTPATIWAHFYNSG